MRKNALVVHPDNATRILLERWVRSEGYVAHSVPSGEEAVRIASRARVDLIVLDRLAPDTACADAILQLVSHPPAAGIPIRVVNADAEGLPIMAPGRRTR